MRKVQKKVTISAEEQREMFREIKCATLAATYRIKGRGYGKLGFDLDNLALVEAKAESSSASEAPTFPLLASELHPIVPVHLITGSDTSRFPLIPVWHKVDRLVKEIFPSGFSS